jgi:hypothetical protein
MCLEKKAECHGVARSEEEVDLFPDNYTVVSLSGKQPVPLSDRAKVMLVSLSLNTSLARSHRITVE